MARKRTKALDISPKVRAAVYARDSWENTPCCVYCGSLRNLTAAHYIARSRSGLGIEQNLVTLCIYCHDKYDHGKPDDRRAIKRQLKEYLQSKYPNWSEKDLTYKRD